MAESWTLENELDDAHLYLDRLKVPRANAAHGTVLSLAGRILYLAEDRCAAIAAAAPHVATDEAQAPCGPSVTSPRDLFAVCARCEHLGEHHVNDAANEHEMPGRCKVALCVCMHFRPAPLPT